MRDVIEVARWSSSCDSVVFLRSAGVALDESVSFLGDARLGPGPYSYKPCKLREHYFKLPKDLFGGGELLLYSVELLASPNSITELPDLRCCGDVLLLRPLDVGERHGRITRGYWNGCPSDVTILKGSDLSVLGDSISLFEDKVSK